eukprot:XP_011681008.1 PREDICTED: uncharacterized protein LOC105446202 [Strongylocentrotus purpuratus]
MNSWYLQFGFAMVLVINGIICCKSDPDVLHCINRGNDGTETFTVVAGADDGDVLPKVSLDVNASIICNSDTRDSEDFSFKIECQDEWRILLRVPKADGRIVVEAFDDELEDHSISSQTQQIDPDPDSACSVNQASQGPTTLVSCPTPSSYDIALISFDDGNQRSFTVICWFGVGYQPTSMRASCSRMPGKLQVDLPVPRNVDIIWGAILFLRYAPDPSVGSRSANPMTTVTTIEASQPNSANPMTTVTTNGSSQPNSGKSNAASTVVPIVVVLVAVFLLVALVATIWRKRRNKQASAHAENVSAHNGPYLHNHVSSEGGDATDKSPRYVTSNAGPEGDCTVALNIRSTVNQNEDTVVYNEIGEQNYNTLFGGKEKDDYHEYNVPDRPQEKTCVDRTTASGSGPYQELLQDGTRAVTAVNRSPGVTGPKHGVADDLHAYQDLRQDDSNVNQLPSKDTSAIENGYQALKTATPEYATLEPSPEYATLEQNDQSVKGTSDVSGPPPDKEYDTLQRSLNTVGQPPSAGYGNLKPMNETDADYESPDGQPKTTSNFEDSTRPTEALPNNQPKTMHPGFYDDDDYQTPIEPAEDLTNAYPTLDNPGYQQEPDTQADEYSHLQRSLGAKLQSHPSSNHNNSDSYGKLHLNSTP